MGDTDRSSRLDLAPILIVSLVAMVSLGLMLRYTHHGVAISKDSTFYLGGAQSLRDGHGYNMKPGATIVWHAPGYSFVLAAMAFVHGDLLADARALNAVLLLIAVGLLAVLLRRAGAGWPVTALFTAAVAWSYPFVRAYSFAWSEALFIPLELASAVALGTYLDTGRRRAAALAGLALGAAALTRYTAFPLVAAAVVMVVVLGRPPLRRRCTDAAALLAIAAVGPGCWLARNWARTGTLTGRHLSYLPPPLSVLTRGVRTAASWFAPTATHWPGWIAAVVVFVALIVACLAVRRTRPRMQATVLGVLFATYMASLLLSRVFIDHRTPFDARILLPAQVLLVLLAGLALPEDWIPAAEEPGGHPSEAGDPRR
jgi:hypothetical protein